MDDELMIIPNDDAQDYPIVNYNMWLKLEWINQSKFKNVLKVVKPTNKKRYYKTLETSEINIPLSPLSLF